jgi:ribosomal protein S18 acetylase RimI-like enzyme
MTTQNENLTFRKIISTDHEKLFNYLNNLSDESKRRFGPHPFDYDTVGRICYQTDSDYTYFVVEKTDSSRLIAYAILKKGTLDFEKSRLEGYGLILDNDSDYVLAPSVADDYQSKGIGNLLMEFLISELKVIDAKRIILWGGVQKDNQRAVNYYLKHHFTIIGEFEYNGQNFDMIKNLP